jgi:hypothetical protein
VSRINKNAEIWQDILAKSAALALELQTAKSSIGGYSNEKGKSNQVRCGISTGRFVACQKPG